MLGDCRLEYVVRFLVEDAECWEVREGSNLLVEDSEVETLGAGKGFVSDNFGGQEQISLLSLRLHLDTLLVQPSF